MPFPKSCRGKEAKVKIVRHYSLSCVGHLKLLPGQDKQGCCGLLTDEYYAFEYQNRESAEDAGVFYAGRSCALDFQEIHRPRIEFPKLFNPFHRPSSKSNYGTEGSRAGGRVAIGIDPLNAEVQTAIYLILTLWNAPPTGGFVAILNFITNRPSTRTQDWTVRKVNSIVGQYMNGRTLRQALLDASEGVPMRPLRFPEMERVLAESGQTCHL